MCCAPRAVMGYACHTGFVGLQWNRGCVPFFSKKNIHSEGVEAGPWGIMGSRATILWPLRHCSSGKQHEPSRDWSSVQQRYTSTEPSRDLRSGQQGYATPLPSLQGNRATLQLNLQGNGAPGSRATLQLNHERSKKDDAGEGRT